MVEIAPGVVIADEEISYVTSRASGPGGQNVNKVETRVTLLFDVESSSALTVEQKERVRERLASRVSKTGIFRVTSQRHRSQMANREAALARFVELLGGALEEENPRRPMRPGRGARQRRLAEKKQRGEVKRRRSWSPSPEEY